MLLYIYIYVGSESIFLSFCDYASRHPWPIHIQSHCLSIPWCFFIHVYTVAFGDWKSLYGLDDLLRAYNFYILLFLKHTSSLILYTITKRKNKQQYIFFVIITSIELLNNLTLFRGKNIPEKIYDLQVTFLLYKLKLLIWSYSIRSYERFSEHTKPISYQ